MEHKIFGRNKYGNLTIELWTLVPAIFLFGLSLIAIENKGFNINSFEDLIMLTFGFSCVMGLIYSGEYCYKKLRK